MSKQNIRSRFVFALLKVYKSTLSPLLYSMGVRCRYEPTCSVYMAKSISAHGIWAGSWLGLARLSRCHPLNECDNDPVPKILNSKHRLMPWLYTKWFIVRAKPVTENESEQAIEDSEPSRKKK